MGWGLDNPQCQPAVQFNACFLQLINLLCTLGGSSVGWTWFSLANSALAQPASHVGPLGSSQLWPHCVVWGNNQRVGVPSG